MSKGYRKLRGKIREKFVTQDNFAEAMELNSSTLSAKLNGRTDWTRSEIERAQQLLDIPPTDIAVYFFGQ